MWEKRIGAAGAVISGGVAFIVLAVFLDRVSEQAAQWMQAAGTVLAFVGLLYVHWSDGRRRRAERVQGSALAAEIIAREMRGFIHDANSLLRHSEKYSESEFLAVFSATLDDHFILDYTNEFISKLSVDYRLGAQFAILAVSRAKYLKLHVRDRKNEPLRPDDLEIIKQDLKAIKESASDSDKTFHLVLERKGISGASV